MKKNKILVVEDNINIKDTIKDILSISGYEVKTAINGVDGVKSAIKINPDLIISDIMMPEMDGFSLLKEIQKKLPNVPFIFLSAKSSMSDIRMGMNNGADDYLTKPFSTKELLTAVKKRLERINMIKNGQHKKEVATKQIDLKHSIAYAEKMQQKILPTTSALNEYLPDFFCLHQPKDTLSGDFHWFNQQNKNILIAAVDCTGHGIPGAMTSMIAYSFLNRAVKEINLKTPSKILNSLHHQFADYITSDQSIEFKEGVDIGLCNIDKNSNQLTFAGAKRPLYIIRSKNKRPIEEAKHITKRDSFILYEIKGDAYSIGASIPKIYNDYKIDLEPSDKIYLFSDGFADQFGGSSNKKFGTNRLRNLLLHIQNKTMNQQKEILKKTLEKWRNWNNKNGVVEEQTDDILIIGINI